MYQTWFISWDPPRDAHDGVFGADDVDMSLVLSYSRSPQRVSRVHNDDLDGHGKDDNWRRAANAWLCTCCNVLKTTVGWWRPKYGESEDYYIGAVE